MKMYEKMGIDPTTKEGIELIYIMTCVDIPDDINKKRACSHYKSCSKCIADRLCAEVPTKKIKRWEKYNGDFTKALIDWGNQAKCKCCKICEHPISECFALWLMEEIEVEA